LFAQQKVKVKIMEGLEYLNKIAVAKTGTIPRIEHGEGEVIAYSGAPMVCIRRKDGSTFWWRVDLCEFTPNTACTGLAPTGAQVGEGSTGASQ
jgi:hypothetical protein